MKIVQRIVLLCGVCLSAWAVEPISKVELIAQASLVDAVATLDVDAVTASLKLLEAARAHVDLVPLLEKLSVTKPLVRRWPAKLVAAGGCFATFAVVGGLSDGASDRVVVPLIVLAGGLFGTYRGYKAFIGARMHRARKIVDALLASPAGFVGDATAARKAIIDVARLAGYSSEEMVRLCGAIDAKIVRT